MNPYTKKLSEIILSKLELRGYPYLLFFDSDKENTYPFTLYSVEEYDVIRYPSLHHVFEAIALYGMTILGDDVIDLNKTLLT
jgi:hypothetical protein